MTPQEKLRLRLYSLIEDLMSETQKFYGQTEWSKVKIRTLVVELDELVRKILEKS